MQEQLDLNPSSAASLIRAITQIASIPARRLPRTDGVWLLRTITLTRRIPLDAAIANQLQNSRGHATARTMRLDELPIGQKARIASVDWAALVPEEGQRLRALGLDEGAKVSLAFRGIFAGRDPLAVEIGRMTVALRRVHAHAMTVEAL